MHGYEDTNIEGHINKENEALVENRYYTPKEEELIYAIYERKPKRVKYLIEQGANTNYISKSGWSALMCACETVVPQTVYILLQNGADPNYNSGQYTSLMCLCISEFLFDDVQLIECFNLLVLAGANVNAKSCTSVTALMLAARAGYSHLITCLLSHGANLEDVADNGWSAMFYGVSSNNPEVVRVLKRAGSNLSLRDKNGAKISDFISANESVVSRILDAEENCHFSLDAKTLENKNLLRSPMPYTIYYGYTEEVLKILNVTGLKYLMPLFIQKKIGYGQFLTFNDEEWMRMGVTHCYDREKLMWHANHFLQTCWASGVSWTVGHSDINQFWLNQILARITE